MIYELRIYHIHPGRMHAIHDRFENHTFSLFARHGLKVVDFWEDLTENTIYYTMEHKSREARDKNFSAFINDPEWVQVVAESEAAGPIVERIESYYMRRVPYSPASL